MANPANTRRFLSGLAAFITMLLSSAVVFLSLGEFYKVKVLRQYSGYPFGGEGPAPYYYKTAALYANVHLAWGLIFFLIFLLSIWAAVKGQRKKMFLLLCISVLLLFVLLIQGQAVN